MACDRSWAARIGRSGALQALRIMLIAWATSAAAVAGGESPAKSSTGMSDAAEADARAGAPTDALDVPGRVAPRNGGGNPGLDDLLRLPSDFDTQPRSRPVAGASEDEWRSRFVRAEKAIGEAREALVETKKELDALAETGGSSQWSVAPPGASSGGSQSTSPLSFKLRQQLARERDALEEAEKALRDLRIEADLAGVPPGWRVVALNPRAPIAPN